MDNGAPRERDGGGLGADGGQGGVEISWHTGREHSPCWSTFGSGYVASPRTRKLVGAIERPFNSRGERHMQRADNLVTAFRSASS